jgi:hypothetical protein
MNKVVYRIYEEFLQFSHKRTNKPIKQLLKGNEPIPEKRSTSLVTAKMQIKPQQESTCHPHISKTQITVLPRCREFRTLMHC